MPDFPDLKKHFAKQQPLVQSRDRRRLAEQCHRALLIAACKDTTTLAELVNQAGSYHALADSIAESAVVHASALQNAMDRAEHQELVDAVEQGGKR